jgi:aspartyl-tRNA(Asn)/glutamyl-tRNA(Gln) amidotransferase subunit A
LRIGIIEHFYTEDSAGDPEQVRGIERATEVLRQLGAIVRPIHLSPLSTWMECNRTLHQAESYVIHERDLQERPQDYAAITLTKMLPGAFVSAAKYIKAQQLRRVLCQQFSDAMRELDAVVTLSSHDLPTRLDDPAATARTYDRQCRLVFNVTGTPTISVPTGFSASGMPLAMQISGRVFDDPMVYRVAFAYCEATGFADKRASIKETAQLATASA